MYKQKNYTVINKEGKCIVHIVIVTKMCLVSAERDHCKLLESGLFVLAVKFYKGTFTISF